MTRPQHCAALVAYDGVTCEVRRTVPMMASVSKDDQKLFLQSLLEIPWLPSAVRRAVMVELGLSLRTHKHGIEEAQTTTLRVLLAEREQFLRANGKPPRGDIHQAALEDVARVRGMTVEALEQRIKRQRKRHRGPREQSGGQN
jgi:hypothetical protein